MLKRNMFGIESLIAFFERHLTTILLMILIPVVILIYECVRSRFTNHGKKNQEQTPESIIQTGVGSNQDTAIEKDQSSSDLPSYEESQKLHQNPDSSKNLHDDDVVSEDVQYIGEEGYPCINCTEIVRDGNKQMDKEWKTFTSEKDSEAHDLPKMPFEDEVMSQEDDVELPDEASCWDRSLQHYHSKLATEPFSFVVDKEGCFVSTPYCKLSFPPGATDQSLDITMSPVYNQPAIFDDKIFVSPHVNFKSDQELMFSKKITVRLHTGYTAADNTKNVEVQVLWKKDRLSQYELHQNRFLGNKRFISFTCKHFCGYTVTADQSQYQNMQRHYYYIGYLRKPKNELDRILHWTVFEDSPDTYAQVIDYLKDREMVIDPESFGLRYNYNLQLQVVERQLSVSRNNQTSHLSKKWSSKVNESFQFRLERDPQIVRDHQEIEYKMVAIHQHRQVILDVASKHFFLDWSNVEEHPGTVINVQGSHATGMHIQSQSSVASNYSDAGYESVPSPSSGQHGFSLLDDSSSPMRQVEDSMLEDEDVGASMGPLTTPKEVNQIPPLAQSTPNDSIVMQEEVDEFEDGEESRGFNDEPN